MEDDADVRHERLSIGEREAQASDRAVAGHCDYLVAKFGNCFAEFLEQLQKSDYAMVRCGATGILTASSNSSSIRVWMSLPFFFRISK